MKISRRSFLKLTGAAVGTATLASLGFADSGERRCPYSMQKK